MGRSFFCFRLFSSPRKLPKQYLFHDDRRVTSFTTSIIDFMKQSCLWKPKTEKKKLTLEEWFSTSSPCKDDVKEVNLIHINGLAEQHNNWLFPSCDEDADDVVFNSRHSFSHKRLLIEVVDSSGRRKSDASCVSSRKSGKVKKRVSFRLPEEADIFIFCSPREDYYEA